MRDSGAARLEMRRGRRAVRAEGRLPRRPHRQALRRLADARQAGRPAAARAEPAAARRADELPRPADADPARALPARATGPACLIVSHDRAFLGATCDHTLDLSRGKLTTFPGKVDAFLEFQKEQREHDERSNAAVLAKRRHLEDFIARNKARAATADAGPVEEQAAREAGADRDRRRRADGPHPRPARRAAQGPGAALPRPGHRLPRPADRRRTSSWKSTTARGRPSSATTARGRRRSCARSSTRSSRWPAKSAGATAARSASTPSTSTPACRRSRRSSTTCSSRPPAARRTRRFSTSPGRSCSAGRTSRSRSRSCPAASAPGSASRACC